MTPLAPEGRTHADHYIGHPGEQCDQHLDRQDPRLVGLDARLDELVEFVVQLASGRLGVRMAPSSASDAVDAVVVGLNMVGEELQALTDGLEQRVAERTRELAEAREELERLALYDSLTGLANRTLLGQRLEQALSRAARGGSPPAVLVLDLDGFKAVNDGFGHPVGDELLAVVASRLRAAVGDRDTVARLGGDEFAVVVEDHEPGEVLDVADRVQQAVATPAHAGGHTCFVGASIGVCFAVAGQTSDSVLGDADLAMYTGKHRSPGGVVVFEPAMRRAAVERTRLADQLRCAVSDSRQQLSLIYQPIVELATGRVVAAEALLRWQHPTRGLLRPPSFLTVTDTALMAALDRWVLDAAATQMSRWRATALGEEPFAVHVNMSPLGLRVPRFAEHVIGTLAGRGVRAGDVTVEITEHQTLIEDPASMDAITALRGAGVRVAVDEFGSGPSSLSYVRQSLVDTIKIDRSLVRGIDVDARQQQVAAAILSVVDAFGLDTVAEGVETAGEAARLHALGCRYGQGRLWSPPVPADTLMDLWRDRPLP